jgi:hypothetical protein
VSRLGQKVHSEVPGHVSLCVFASLFNYWPYNSAIGRTFNQCHYNVFPANSLPPEDDNAHT